MVVSWRLLFFLLLVHVSVLSATTSAANKIKHVVVVMEENRSFDHMFGWFTGVNGLTGKEYNSVNTSDPKSEKIFVDSKAPFVAPCDPDHGTPATTSKIFGAGAVSRNDTTNALMDGFVEWENKLGNAKTNYCMVMSMQEPAHLPIMAALSSEFALMDRFFAAHPGPTWPNRLFMLSATSAGSTSTGVFYHDQPGALFPQKTIFDQLTSEGLTWRNYYNDTPWELFLETIADHPENLASMEKFYADAAAGTLPSFSWINPRAGMNITLNQGSNDQHPDHDVALGERYYKDIYEALRSSPSWNDTLYIITYDEHGGFFDHVPTPLGVPPPGDGETSYPTPDFLFDRLGVRIPALIISPWIPKGIVESAPPTAQKPASNSEYSLTSIMATTRILLGMTSKPLTDRDAWSPTFEHLLSLDTPRTDCPIHLPDAPPPTLLPADEALLPVNGLQRDIMEMHANAAGVKVPSDIRTQGQVSEWLQQQFLVHSERTTQRKANK